jgi:hypothetical protein
MSSKTFYKDLADAIYFGDSNHQQPVAAHDSDELTLTEAVVVNGRTLIPATTLKISKPVVQR